MRKLMDNKATYFCVLKLRKNKLKGNKSLEATDHN